jgi:hypothetical protein
VNHQSYGPTVWTDLQIGRDRRVPAAGCIEGIARETVPETSIRIHFGLQGGDGRAHRFAAQSVERFALRRGEFFGPGLLWLPDLFLLACGEHEAGVKLLWFAPIMAGGNIATALCVLLQLFGLRGA